MSVAAEERAAARPASKRWTAVVAGLVCAGTALLIGTAVMMLAVRPAPAYPWPLLLVAAPTLAVGCLICLRRPAETVGRLLLGIGVAMSGMIALGEYATYSTFGRVEPLPLTGAAAWVSSVLQAGAVFAILVVLVAYPTGHLLSPRWRWLWWAVAIAGVTAFGVTAFGGPTFNSNLDTIHNPVGIDHPTPALAALVALGDAVTFLAIGGAVAQLVVRLIRSRGDEREQLKWFVYVAVVGPLLLWIVPGLLPSSWDSWVLNAAWTIVPIALVSSIAVAILRYRLYDIDVVIRKTLVFGLLALFVTLVYAAVVAGLGTLAGAHTPALAFGAAIVVAVAFQPVRERARQLADRLVYGKRATPYEVLTEFSQQAAGTGATDEILPRIAEVVGRGTGSRRVRVWLRVGSTFVPSASWPEEDGTPEPIPAGRDELPEIEATRLFPVRHGGALLGAIALDEDPADPLTEPRTKLVRDLAAQAGLVLRNVGLVEDLRASRQRIVSAQDQERRRIQRVLRDGAERHLVGLDQSLEETEAVAAAEGAAPIAHAVHDLRTDARSALENLRDLARGVYPAVLEQEGIVRALEAQAGTSPVPVVVDGDVAARFPIEIEATVYFCALEALQNASKYADPSMVWVRVATGDGAVAFEVRDDGRGFDPAVAGYGTGLQGISDRLSTVGGSLEVRSAPGEGTTVIGTVPLPHASPSEARSLALASASGEPAQ
ncbi:MAG TPA: ATP-binding protein [Actinomycetota bacterium]|nr:ATP-binding protein [Actinomycetota bacterium]